MADVEIIKVIKTRLTQRGNGTQLNPDRVVEQYWDLDGRLLWEVDPFDENAAHR